MSAGERRDNENISSILRVESVSLIQNVLFTFQPQKAQKSEAEINEALRIQAEKNLVIHQQKILEQQPFALDGGKVSTCRLFTSVGIST